MWREIKQISEHVKDLFTKGVYDPMRPETLPFTYKDLENYCRSREIDPYEYLDPTERGGICGHPSYEIDDYDEDEEEVY